MTITIPELALVLLIGPSGSGKSTFARRHFKPTEVLSSDFFRGLVCDDEGNQAASRDAFDVLHLVVERRLARGRLTVVDATNVQPDARKPLLALARRYHVQTVAVVFNLPEELCQLYNLQRPGRNVIPDIVSGQVQLLQKTLHALQRERFSRFYVLSGPEEIEAAVVERQSLPVNRRDEHGPFDIIGDVHGCFDELLELLRRLGYDVTGTGEGVAAQGYAVRPPEWRKVVFVGDLVDRGPNIPGVLRLVMGMVEAGAALCVRGNHDDKLLRKLLGHEVRLTHGLEASVTQLAAEPPEFVDRVRTFLDSLPSHFVLAGGKLVVAHAGLIAELQGRVSGVVREFALYGDVTGKKDVYGMPERRNWAAEYHGHSTVVYGHTPVAAAEWVNRTINIDTGCVFGGALTALRYPEQVLVSLPALKTYAVPGRPFLAPGAASAGARVEEPPSNSGLGDISPR
jgi:protein phosphatase